MILFDAFQRPVVVGARLGVGMDRDRARPQLLRAHPGKIDRGFAVHTRRGRHVAIELIGRDDARTLGLPVGWGLSLPGM